MSYKDKEKQREYQRQWIVKRRADFFKDKSCIICSSIKNLELDHIDPSTKVSHNIWSWSKERRLKELVKCQVLCHDHHTEKSSNEKAKGVYLPWTILDADKVKTIRQLKQEGLSYDQLARMYKVTKYSIRDIIKSKNWRHVT